MVLDKTELFYVFVSVKGNIAAAVLRVYYGTIGISAYVEITFPKSVLNALDALLDGALGAGHVYIKMLD
eukprot:665575-Pyramimonas_sp.AAC.1